MKNAFFILAVLAAFIGGDALAGEKTEDSVARKPAIVCHPEVLTEDDKKRGVEPPCAPDNYVYVPLAEVQEKVMHDKSGMWTDDEVWNPGGASVYNSRVTVGNADVTVSSAVGGMCGTPSTCPMKVRIQKQGQPDRFFDLGLVNVSGGEFFIRNDLGELMIGDKRHRLK